MSSYHSDKTDEFELLAFKDEVIKWLNEIFPNWRQKFKLKVFNCYGGDARLYDGTFNDFPNRKSSFRRSEPNYNEKGEVIGWNGTRGVHSTKTASYISINKDEFEVLKKLWDDKSGEEYAFYNDLIFRHFV